MAAPMAKHFRVFLNVQIQGFHKVTNLTTYNRWIMTKSLSLPRHLGVIPNCQAIRQCHSTLTRGRTDVRSLGQITPSGYTLLLQRSLASGTELDEAAVKSKIDDIADKFMEARELLEDARDVKGTVYFSEDMKEAAEAVDETLKDYSDFLAQLNEKQKQEVLRTIGLKMEELKAHKEMLVQELLEEE